MRWLLPFLAASAALMLALPGTAAPLLDDVDNGGFEQWTAAGPAGWTVLSGVVAPSSSADSGGVAAVMTLPSNGTVASLAQAVDNVGDTLGSTGSDADPPVVAGSWYELDFAANLNTGANGIPTASGQVLWLDAAGGVARVDTVPIAATQHYGHYSATLQAPLPGAGDPAPVVSAELRFTLGTPSPTSPHDVLLFVDSVAFGNVAPPLPALPA